MLGHLFLLFDFTYLPRAAYSSKKRRGWLNFVNGTYPRIVLMIELSCVIDLVDVFYLRKLNKNLTHFCKVAWFSWT